MPFTRASANMIGSPASPATVATGNGTQTGTYDCTNPASQVETAFVCRLIAGATAPTQAIAVKWEASLDGSNYVVDAIQSFILTNGASTDAWYVPADPVQKVKCTVTNPDASQAITCWAQGSATIGP